jgi:hypothetical protein
MEVSPAEIDVRVCQCSFCLKRGPRAMARPTQAIRIDFNADRNAV